MCNGGVDFGRIPSQQFQRGIEPCGHEHHHAQPNVVVGYKNDVSDVHCNAHDVQAATGPFGHARQNDGALFVIRNVEPHGLAAGFVQLRAQAVVIHVCQCGSGVNDAHHDRRIYAC